MQRQTAFTQAEVTEMQKGHIKNLEKIKESASEMLIRLSKGANVIDLLEHFIKRIGKEIDVINKDIEIEADHDQII